MHILVRCPRLVSHHSHPRDSSKKPVSIISYLSLGRYLSAPQRTPVWLFVPNQIGYLRALLALWAFVYALPHSWGKTAMAAAAADAPSFVALYFASYILDAADGMAARALGQTSAFGALLDMVRERARVELSPLPSTTTARTPISAAACRRPSACR